MLRLPIKIIPALILLILSNLPQNLLASSIYVSKTNTETIFGQRYYDEDVIEYNTITGSQTVIFDGSVIIPASFNDVNAFDILNDGSFLLSTTNDVSLNGATYNRDDIFRYNPSNGSSSLILNGSSVFSNSIEISGVSNLSNGNIVFATHQEAEISNVSFGRSDLIEYNPATGATSLYLAGDYIFGYNPARYIYGIDILENGNLILAISGATGFELSGEDFSGGDLIEFNPLTRQASLFLNSEEIYSTAEVVDALAVSNVPIPSAVWLLGSGLVGLVAVRRRKQL